MRGEGSRVRVVRRWGCEGILNFAFGGGVASIISFGWRQQPFTNV